MRVELLLLILIIFLSSSFLWNSSNHIANADPIVLDTITHTSGGFNSGGTTDETLGITIANNFNRILIVELTEYDITNNNNVNTVKLGSTDLIKAVEDQDNGLGQYSSIWYLVNPPTGAGTITVNFQANHASFTIGAYSLYNVNQLTPIGVTNSNSGTSSIVSTSITPTHVGAWIIDSVGVNDFGSISGSGNKIQGFYEITGALQGASQYNNAPVIGSSNSLTWQSSLHWISTALEVVPTTIILPPTGLTATPISNSQINLAWNAPSGVFDGYKIERQTPAGDFNRFFTPTTLNIGQNGALSAAYDNRESEIFDAGSSMIGKVVKSINATVQNQLVATGNLLTVTIRDRADNLITQTTVDAVNITAYAITPKINYTFTFPTSRVIQVGDRISLEFTGGSASHYFVVFGGNTNQPANSRLASFVADTYLPQAGQTMALILNPTQIQGNNWKTIISNTNSTSTLFSNTGLNTTTQYNYRVSAINSTNLFKFYTHSSNVMGTNGALSSVYDLREAEVFDSGSNAIGKTVHSVDAVMDRTTNINTGIFTVAIRNSTDFVITSVSQDLSLLHASTDQHYNYTFTFPSARTIQTGDKISFEFSGGDATHYLQLYGSTTNLPANSHVSSYFAGTWHDSFTQAISLTFNPIITSVPSNLANATTTANPPNPPTSLTATPISNSQINLGWLAPQPLPNPLSKNNLEAYWNFNQTGFPLTNNAANVGSTSSLGSNADILGTSAIFNIQGIFNNAINQSSAGNRELVGTSNGDLCSSLPTDPACTQFSFMHNATALYTASIWAREKATGQTITGLFSTSDGSCCTRTVGVVITLLAGDTAGKRNFEVAESCAGGTYQVGQVWSNVVNDDTNWHMYAVEYNATGGANNLKLSVDGGTFLTATVGATCGGVGTAGYPMNIGNWATRSFGFIGTLDEAYILHRLLPLSDLQTIYNNGNGFDPTSTTIFTVRGYKIERESPILNGFSTLVANTTTTSTAFSDMGLTTATQYNYRVSTLGAGGLSSSPSNQANATTLGNGTAPITGGSGTGGAGAGLQYPSAPSTSFAPNQQLPQVSLTVNPKAYSLNAGAIQNELLELNWAGMSQLQVSKIIVGQTPLTFNFPETPLSLTGTNGKTQGTIPFTISIPRLYCSGAQNVFVNCITPTIYSIPVTIVGTIAGQTVTQSTTILVDLTPYKGLTSYLILAGLAGGMIAGLYIIIKTLGKKTHGRKIKQRKLSKSYEKELKRSGGKSFDKEIANEFKKIEREGY